MGETERRKSWRLDALWEAAEEPALRCWLRQAATCTVPRSSSRGRVIHYKNQNNPPPPTNKKNRGSHSEVFVQKEEAQVMEGRGSGCRLGPKVKRLKE